MDYSYTKHFALTDIYELLKSDHAYFTCGRDIRKCL